MFSSFTVTFSLLELHWILELVYYGTYDYRQSVSPSESIHQSARGHTRTVPRTDTVKAVGTVGTYSTEDEWRTDEDRRDKIKKMIHVAFSLLFYKVTSSIWLC